MDDKITIKTLLTEDITIYYPLKCGDRYEVMPYSFIGAIGSFSNAEDIVEFISDSFLTEEGCQVWCDTLNKAEECTPEFQKGLISGICNGVEAYEVKDNTIRNVNLEEVNETRSEYFKRINN